jgi:hypothetical protein
MQCYVVVLLPDNLYKKPDRVNFEAFTFRP